MDNGEVITKRVRIELSTTAKGIKTYSCTVEWTGEDVTPSMVLKEHDGLVADLDSRYKITDD